MLLRVRRALSAEVTYHAVVLSLPYARREWIVWVTKATENASRRTQLTHAVMTIAHSTACLQFINNIEFVLENTAGQYNYTMACGVAWLCPLTVAWPCDCDRVHFAPWKIAHFSVA